MYLGNQAGKSFEIKMDKQKEMEKVEIFFGAVWVIKIQLSNEMLNSERTPT